MTRGPFEPDSSSNPPGEGALGERPTRLMPLVFAAIAVLAAVDIVKDLVEGTTPTHVAIELAVVALGLVGMTMTLSRYLRTLRRVHALETEAVELTAALEATRREAEAWRADAADLIEGLGQAIDQQFDRWELSGAEREVALLLLKGLSMRELAEVRGVSEATSRQQARAVYRKGGLAGRHDLSAFFLEDLLAPISSPDRSAEPET